MSNSFLSSTKDNRKTNLDRLIQTLCYPDKMPFVIKFFTAISDITML